ncbi:MAG: glycosyltransferase family 4 protein [Parcubacteria group bacterium]|nr:glycosyltransferase family 4 protein [Parcubacteria group bacterium]
MQKKKILYVVTKGNFGGVQRYVYDLSTNLSKDGFETVVACGEGGLLIEKLKKVNIKTIEIKNLRRDIKLKDDFKAFFNLIKIIKEEKPDIVHLNSSKIGLLGALAVFCLKIVNWKLKIRAIFTAHGWVFNEERSALSKTIFSFLHWLTIILCYKTIVVSEKTKKDVAWMPFIKNKIVLIHNGIKELEASEKMTKQEAIYSLVGEETEKTIIFSVAELHKNKGLDIALLALSSLPEEIKSKIIYCVAGAGEEEQNLKKMVENLDLKKLVKFLGFMPNAQKLLYGADIFLLPSRTEAFPYAILEAGLAGLPIIATSVGGVPEIITDMENGILIHSKNPKEIAEAILYLIEQPNKSKTFGKEIKATVSESFSIEKMLIETKKIYN